MVGSQETPLVMRGRSVPIRRSSLHDEIVIRLRGMILENILPPGSHIAEAQLCEEMGISRTPLREALKVLASEGLIELRPNRGSVVAPIALDEVAGMFELLEHLEHMIGSLVPQRLTQAGLAELDALHSQLRRLHQSGDRAGYFRTNQSIHQRLMQAVGNPALESVYDSLAAKIRRARYLANYDAVRWRESLEEHEAINAALLARDAPRLALLLADHARATGRAVLRALPVSA